MIDDVPISVSFVRWFIIKRNEVEIFPLILFRFFYNDLLRVALKMNFIK